MSAALQLVQKALPDKQFEEQLQRFEALQQRIQSVYDQLKTVEVSLAVMRLEAAPAKEI